jgi:hypothetical protein
MLGQFTVFISGFGRPSARLRSTPDAVCSALNALSILQFEPAHRFRQVALGGLALLAAPRSADEGPGSQRRAPSTNAAAIRICTSAAVSNRGRAGARAVCGPHRHRATVDCCDPSAGRHHYHRFSCQHLMARVKRLFTGDEFTQRRRLFAYHSRRFRDVGCEPTFPRNRHRQSGPATSENANRRHRACGELLRNNHIDRLMPCLISSSHGSARIARRAGGRIGDATCLSTIVPRARTSLLKRAPSRPLGPGTSFNCLSSFSVLRRLRPARRSTAVRNSNFVSPSRQASLPHDRTASFVTNRRVASVRKHNAVRAAPPCDPDAGRLAGSCQLR